MASALKSLWGKVGGGSDAKLHPDGFSKAPVDQLFPKTNPAVDGEECLRDCETCTIKYPRKWSVDEDENMYGHIKGWSTHMIVATGKADWVSQRRHCIWCAVRIDVLTAGQGRGGREGLHHGGRG